MSFGLKRGGGDVSKEGYHVAEINRSGTYLITDGGSQAWAIVTQRGVIRVDVPTQPAKLLVFLVKDKGAPVPPLPAALPVVFARIGCGVLSRGRRSFMSAQRFQGKVAVVTGGNSGIGLGVAKAYAREGAQVAITGRNKTTLQAAAQEIGEGTLAIQSDAGKVVEIEAAMNRIKERFGRIDALFVNAGVAKLVPFDQVTEALFDETVDINMKGVFFTVQKAIPLMSKGSAIVLNASINAHLGMPGTTVYGASKAAVVNMAKTLSAELLERGIRVNAVSPGPITSSLLRDGPQEKIQETKDWIQSQVPLKRFGTPEEIAAGVLYLTAAESAFVLGAELIIDGGMATL